MPEPILVSIAAALAAKSATSLYELVKRRFAGREKAEAVLEAAAGAAPDSPEVAALADQLTEESTSDPGFGDELRRAWQVTAGGSVTNNVTGKASKFVQARDIEGGVRIS